VENSKDPRDIYWCCARETVSEYCGEIGVFFRNGHGKDFQLEESTDITDMKTRLSGTVIALSDGQRSADLSTGRVGDEYS